MSFRPPNQVDRSTTATVDFSAIGLGFWTREKLEIGQEISFRLTLPWKEIVVLGRVVRIVEKDIDYIDFKGNQEYNIGVKLIEPVEFDEFELVKFYASEFLKLFKKIANHKRKKRRRIKSKMKIIPHPASHKKFLHHRFQKT